MQTLDNELNDAVVVALGSNLSGRYSTRQDLLAAALGAFPAFGLGVVKASGWWNSAAWPDSSGPDYLNGVAIVETSLGPRETLGRLMALEWHFDRVRGPRHGSRTLDLDLIAHGRAIRSGSELSLPHPQAHRRLFVMGPLAEIAPGWTHPILGESSADLASRCVVGVDAKPFLAA